MISVLLTLVCSLFEAPLLLAIGGPLLRQFLSPVRVRFGVFRTLLDSFSE
jgi:hypothetical protein